MHFFTFTKCRKVLFFVVFYNFISLWLELEK